MPLNNIVVFRGGGDVATGSIQKLFRTGFKVLVLEMKKPLCIRRYVSTAQAIFDGEVRIEDFTARKVENLDQIKKAWDENVVPVFVDPKAEILEELKPMAVVDGTLAKKNIGTNKNMADITIALGPGYEAGVDVDYVIETNRGHDLGRLIFEGFAEKNTGIPGNIKGFTSERILRAVDDGEIQVIEDIGSVVKKDQVVALVNGKEIKSQLDGMVRGMIGNGSFVTKGLKIGDVDPRVIPKNAKTISDKARLIGGGCLEAILIGKRRIENGYTNS